MPVATTYLRDSVSAADIDRFEDDLFSEAFEANPLPSCILSLDRWQLIRANQSFTDLLGLNPDAIHCHDPASIGLFPSDDDGNRVRDLLSEDGRVANQEFSLQIATDKCLVVLLSGIRIEYAGESCGLLWAQDITEQKQLERRVLEISGVEQRRLGQDLHDGLGPYLTAMAMLSRGLSREVRAGRTIPAERLDEIAQLAVQSTKEARALSRRLYPIVLEVNGLAGALCELMDSIIGPTGIEHSFECPDALPELDSQVAVHLYRIAQEGLTNVLRHAHARHLTVRIAIEGNQFILSVVDDGIGMPLSREMSTGIGLRTVEYRAKIIGATCRIESNGHGTSLICSLPLRPTAHNGRL